MIVNMVIGTNIDRNEVPVKTDSTIRQILEENEVNYTRGVVQLNGASLRNEDLDKTLDDYGITTKGFLFSIVKADNA